MTEQPSGLRELRKQQTRQSISDTATRMFLADGFDKVTIADIAAATGVAKMTVTNYFPRKEDLVFDLQDEFTLGLARAVRTRPAGSTPLEALHADFTARLNAHDPAIGFAGRAFARMIRESPALSGRLRELHEMREAALAEVLAEETGAAPGDLEPYVVAAQLAGVLRVLFTEIKDRGERGEDDDAIAAAVKAQAELAFASLVTGVGGYGVRDADARQ